MANGRIANTFMILMISENVLLSMVWPLLFTQVSNVDKIEEVKGRYAAFGFEDRGH